MSIAARSRSAARSTTSRGAARPCSSIAGMSPATQEGELLGGRNEFIHWLQDVPDQRGILRQYVKYDNEIRSSRNVPQIVHRALQIAQSDPKGPVYLVAARETMEATAEPARIRPAALAAGPAAPLRDDAVAEIADRARGRPAAANRDLLSRTQRRGCRRADAPLPRLGGRRPRIGAVLHELPARRRYASRRLLERTVRNPVLAEADVVLVIDSDVPWIPSVNAASPDAAIYHIDVDPLKETMPLWYIKARRSLPRRQPPRAATAQRAGSTPRPPQASAVAERRGHFSALHRRRADELAEREAARTDIITPEWLTACVRRPSTTKRSCSARASPTIRRSTTTPAGASRHHVRQRRQLAGLERRRRDRHEARRARTGSSSRSTGDGSYMFSPPSAVHWMARRYGTPFLQVVYNNRGWKAPQLLGARRPPAGYAQPGRRSRPQLRSSARLRGYRRGRGRRACAHSETARRGRGGDPQRAARRGRREAFRGDRRLAMTRAPADNAPCLEGMGGTCA